jgi:hypothetical protein
MLCRRAGLSTWGNGTTIDRHLHLANIIV